MHAIKYVLWLVWQIVLAANTVLVDTLKGNKGMDPIVVHYPLRLSKDWQITAFAVSITMTPGTMSIGLREDHTLLVHAVYGSDPKAVLEDLAHMEATMAPSVRSIDHDLASATIEQPAPVPERKETP